jgi:PhoH-like ATPase
MVKKTLVIDTSVFLHDSDVLDQHKDCMLVVPGVVLEELDRKKSQNDEVGKHARRVMRFIDYWSRQGDIHKGVALENGSSLRILLDADPKKKSTFPLAYTPDRNRHRLLSTIFQLQEGGERVSLMSKDPITKILAETVGIQTQNHHCQRERYDTLYRGVRTLELPKSTIDQFYVHGEIPLPGGEFYPNEYCILKSEENTSAIARVDSKRKLLVTIFKASGDLWGIKPRNVEQRCAIDLLLRDEVKLVTFIGGAGTGKTLLALAAGLRKVFDEGVYNKIIIARSIMPLGRDIGFLPGTKEEKLRAWLAPFFDNLEYICDSPKNEGDSETKKWILESDKFQVEAITYMRGRSLANTYIIIDEAQNLTPHELKTIISRVGENTKIVVLGDPTQIDNPYLDLDSNGLVHMVGRMKRYDLFGSIFFRQTERSALAALAATVL